MKAKQPKTERWWQLSLLLIVCLFAGSSPTWADAWHFQGSSEHKTLHSPSLQEPYLHFVAMFYDKTANHNAFFTLQKPTSWASKIPNGAADGPALFINGQYVCSPIPEFGWNYNGDGAWSACGSSNNGDTWWKNTYKRTIDGITYTVKFYNPYHQYVGKDQTKRMLVNVVVFPDKLVPGTKYEVTIAGMWRMVSTDQNTPKEEAHTWKFDAIPSQNLGTPKGEMIDYQTVSVQGNLLTAYGPTTVGSHDKANSANLAWSDQLNSGSEPYPQGSGMFTGLKLNFSERNNYFETRSKYIEYVIPHDGFTPSGFDALPNDQRTNVNYYQWVEVKVPGFIKADDLKVSHEDKWKKQLTLEWGTTGTNNKGSWSIYRYPVGKENNKTTVVSGLGTNTRSYVVEAPTYGNTDNDGNKYTYEVAFIPKDAPKQYGELSASVSKTLLRAWSFNIFEGAANEDGNKIDLTWTHNTIDDANTKSYSLKIERQKLGTKDWVSIKTITIDNPKTNSGSYTDDSDLSSNTTYKYRLSISNLLEDVIYSQEIEVSTGGTKVKTLTATRGTYSNMVKLKWEVQLVGNGTSVTDYVVQRRPLGSNDEKAWAEIYTTSGTASVYGYDDVTALPGSFNEYKVTAISKGDNAITRHSMTADGFSLTTGIVSGNITYGTGTAVEGAKVVLKQQDSDGDITSGMHSVRLSGYGAGMKYAADNATLKSFMTNSFSLQMYINPNNEVMSTNNESYILFDVEWALTASIKYDADNKRYKLGVYFAGKNSESQNLYIPAREWSHLSIVYDNAAQTLTMGLTKNGKTQKEVLISNVDWTNNWTEDKAQRADCFAIGNVGQFNQQHYFDGYVDEYRFFTRALSDDEILKNYNHPLAGNEKGLAIYYPFDEGLTTQNLAYDFSKTNNVSNGRHAVTLIPAEGSTYIPSEDQLSLMAYTDETGAYQVRGVPFSGEGTSYTIVPTLGVHQFSPVTRSRFVSMSSLNHSGVDFEDVSSFPVKGKVFYKDTDYPVEGVCFYVDGVKCSKDGLPVETNDKGEFTISVPIGKHYIQAGKNGHVFVNNGRYPADPMDVGVRNEFNDSISNLEFVDSTLVNFTGRVVGGDIQGKPAVGFGLSKNNIGVTEFTLTPLTSYRMNVKKELNGTVIDYVTNNETAPLASATANIQSTSWRGAGEQDCHKFFVRTDSTTGEFSVMVPPLEYTVSTMKLVNDLNGLEVGQSTNINLTNPNMELYDTLYNADGSVKELYSYNTILKQIYHSPASFTVKQKGHDDGSFGISSYTLTDDNGKLEIDDIYTVESDGTVTYKYGGPLFIKEDPYVFNLKGFEEYVNADNQTKDFVPLDGCVVTIHNALSADQSVYVEDGTVEGKTVKAGQLVTLKENQLQLDEKGEATYKWKGGLPNITGNFTRTINITYDIDNQTMNWTGNGMECIILGELPTGANFVTKGPDKPLMILRDPPGSGSSVEWSSGSSTTKSTLRGNTFTENFGVKAQHKFGYEALSIVGTPGVGQIHEAESKDDLTIGAKMESEGENSTTRSFTTSVTKTISTSDSPDFVGDQGDVYIGASTNLIFGKARNVGFKRIGASKDVELTLDDIYTTGLSLETMFQYTRSYIENTLIPNYINLRNDLLTTVPDTSTYKATGDKVVFATELTPDDENFGAEGTYKPCVPSGMTVDKVVMDSIKTFNNQINNWIKIIRQNEEAKVRAYNNRNDKDSVKCTNYSFDAGTTINNTVETDSTTTQTWEWSVSAGVVVENTFGFEINKFGIECTIEDETTGGRHESDETETSHTSSFSYTLAEEGSDALSVDVYEYDAFGPIFRTRGGQTSAPYEGEVRTTYYQDKSGEYPVIMEATMQIEVPEIGVVNNTVTDIPTGSAANYTLKLGNASEIGEDVAYRIFFLDETNPDGAELSIDGKVLTAEGRLIKVPANQTLTKTLQLRQTNSSILNYEGCKDENNELYGKGIGIVFASDSEPEEIADTVFIFAKFVPSSSPVELALSNTLMNTVTGTNLKLTISNFDRNYNNLKAFRLEYKKQGSTDWTKFHEYVLSNPSANEELLPDGAFVSYMLPMNSYADGDYLFRCVSVSSYGQGEVYRYSNEVSLTKDMQRPRPLGQPEPADGILDIGDELSVTFNEPFLNGELTKEANFKVTGVVNGSTLAHNTALSMQNTDAATAQTDADINLAGKSFSIDTWVNLNGAGTILSHGAGSNKMTVATNDNGNLVVTVGGEPHTSLKTVPVNTWAFLTLSYQDTDTGGEISAVVAYDASEENLFVGQPVTRYEGNGQLSVGKNLKGAMHELLLWDEAHDMTTALLNRSKSKNPSTRHLIGYWKMDEGDGKTIRDYAKNRHMTMNGDTWYTNAVNKAAQLDGTQYLSVKTDDLELYSDDDYAVEFWMRGDKQNGEAQLLQMGEVALWTNVEGQLQINGKDAFLPVDQQTSNINTETTVLDNVWHHIALNVLRQGAAALYVDGQRVLTTQASSIGSIATDKLMVGARRTTVTTGEEYTFTNPFKGQIDEVRIWGVTMNADKLSADRKVRLKGDEDGLLLYFPFEKKQLDSGNQIQVVGTLDNMSDISHSAVLNTVNALASTMVYEEGPAMREKPTPKNVNFSYTVSDKKIVIDIEEDPTIIEGCTLNFTVRSLRDENGNYSAPVSWSAFINQKELVWSDDVLSVEQQVKTTSSVTANIVNKSGKQQMWTLAGMPSWLKASAEYGTTNPLEETKVTFTVAESTPIGKYEETIYLKGNNGIETPLTLNVTVTGDVPEWAVNPRDFENSMNLIGSLNVMGVPSEDESDLVAAFIGEECRGIAHPQYSARYDSYFVTMDIYGNGGDNGQMVTFRAYDASTGTVYPVVDVDGKAEGINFVSLSLMGNYKSPTALDTENKIEQNFELKKGWNWLSFYVITDDMKVSSLFGKIAAAVQSVKSQNQFLAYEEGSWDGNLTGNLSNSQMYAVKLNDDCLLRLVGDPVPSNNAVSVAPGWNWIGYYGRQLASVTNALAGMSPEDGDLLKGQSGVAIYDAYEWAGSLLTMVPGSGYQLKSVASTTRTFSYPSAVTAAARMARSSENAQDAETQSATQVFKPVDFRNYPDNATMAVQVVAGSSALSNIELGVFAGDECRAAALTNDEGVAFLSIPGDEPCELTFKVALGNEVMDAPLQLTYESDAMFGSPKHPVIIDLGALTGIYEILSGNGAGSIYDLQGRKINLDDQNRKLRKGVYIINGQKKTVK